MLCCQRDYILPPIYTRLLLFAEYIRLSWGSSDYCTLVQNSALLPTEEGIPISSTTSLLMEKSYKMNQDVLFSLDLLHWSTGSPNLVQFSSVGLHESFSTILYSVITMQSPFSRFSQEQWNMYQYSEARILGGSQNLYQKLKGYWPSHPITEYNHRKRGLDLLTDYEVQKKQQEWCNGLRVALEDISGTHFFHILLAFTDQAIRYSFLGGN
jgi:hypothetical protein